MSQLRARLVPVAVLIGATVWATTFAWLSVARHMAGGSHAEDLGFTDQVLWNFLHGQWFRMSVYNGAATWNTELDLSNVARPDSLLAFHVEPMLLLLVPVYAVGGGAVALLILQALVVGAGAIPAYRIGSHLSGSRVAGLAVSAAYLLSPLGQWAVLSDFHTSALAAPLLLLTVERLVVARAPLQALLAAALAATAREDVGPVIAVLGFAFLVNRQHVPTATSLVALGVGWTIFSVLVIRSYSGGISPLEVRYDATLGSGLGPTLQALARPDVQVYARTLALSGAWLGVLSSLALLPGLPVLAINALSTSVWMAAGKAHYSALLLPVVVLGAVAGLGRLRARPRAMRLAGAALVGTSIVGYALEGAGPLGANYAPALLTDHAKAAAAIAASLPPEAAVSATTALVPRVSSRPRVYVFPAMNDADYVFLDLEASPAPTSAGDVYLRVQSLLASGEWSVSTETDGLMLLSREAPPAAALAPLMGVATGATVPSGEAPTLVAAELTPGPDGAIDVDGPRWILKTTWHTDRALPRGTRLEFWIDTKSGERLHRWDIADLWWNPPERWTPGEDVTVSVDDIPVREFKSWSATWSTT